MFISNEKAASPLRFANPVATPAGNDDHLRHLIFHWGGSLRSRELGGGSISRQDGNIWNVFCTHAKVRAWSI
jgi:hypothetical protein